MAGAQRRQLAEGQIPLPKFLNVVHVEQEIAGDERSALATIVEADEERLWLLRVEQLLLDGDDADEKAMGISLNEVYERLEEIDADNAEARAAQLLAGLGFDAGMQNKPSREYSGGWRMRLAGPPGARARERGVSVWWCGGVDGGGEI